MGNVPLFNHHDESRVGLSNEQGRPFEASAAGILKGAVGKKVKKAPKAKSKA